MKRICIALILVLAAAGCANAGLFGKAQVAFSSKAAIPGAEPIEYRGLSVGANGANITIINRSSDKSYVFNAAVTFLDKRGRELGDFYIPEMTLAPKEQKQLKDIYFKGDPKQAKAAGEQLNWTIYKHEEVK